MTASRPTPTRSNLLALRRQLAFALEGFELLDQKRQTLALELLRRTEQLQRAEEEADRCLASARDALRTALLDSGSAALDRAAVGVSPGHDVSLAAQRFMGLSLPAATIRTDPPAPAFGVVSTSPAADIARRGFAEALPPLAAAAALQTAVLRLGRELRRAQRRCNALTRIVIPAYRRAVHDIAGTLEEREREFFLSRKAVAARRSPPGRRG